MNRTVRNLLDRISSLEAELRAALQEQEVVRRRVIRVRIRRRLTGGIEAVTWYLAAKTRSCAAQNRAQCACGRPRMARDVRRFGQRMKSRPARW